MQRTLFHNWLRRGRAIALAIGLTCFPWGHVGLAQAQQHSPEVVHQTGDPLLQQGVQRYQQGQVEAAIALWQEARQAFQQAENRPGEAATLANLGAAYLNLERYREAAIALESYLPLARALQDKAGEARGLGNLGIAYKSLGIYARAIETQRQAGKLFFDLGDRHGLGQVLLNLGNAFEAVGDYENGATAYQQSLRIFRKLGDLSGEAIALNNLGQIYANQAKYNTAIQTTRNSLAISRTVANLPSQASALINLGSIYHSQNQLAQAKTSYGEALIIARQAQIRRLEAQALGSLGMVYADQQQYEQAIEHLQQSLAIAQPIGDPQLISMTLNNLGHTFFNAGQLQQAERTLREALQLLDQLRPDLSDKYNVSLFDTQIHSYNLLQQILLAANQPEAALEASERGRARAFVELLARRIQPTHPPPQGRSGGMTIEPPTIQQIQQIAQAQNATLVTYGIVPDDDFKFRGKQKARESELLIWVVSPTGKVSFRRVDLKPLWQKNLNLAEVVRVARCFSPGGGCLALANSVRGLGVVGTLPNPTHQPLNLIGLKTLHTLLIEPIADQLPSDPDARIVFIPQESLFLVPFAALQNAQGQYLIERHTILTAPSIQVLGLTTKVGSGRDREKNRKYAFSPLVVGNPTMPKVALQPGSPAVTLTPLPGSEQEAIAIAKLLNTEALIGAAATKDTVLQRLSQASLIHLATHGLLEYSGVSLQSLGIPGAIALAPSPQTDGLLSASEIMELNLQAQLVVLSACDTGQGRITGDGVIGLSRSFIAAGVPSIVVSLWAVPDAPTAQLMVNFYRNLQTTSDYAQALRQAMLTTMKDHPRPIDWAAFTLVGRAKAIP